VPSALAASREIITVEAPWWVTAWLVVSAQRVQGHPRGQGSDMNREQELGPTERSRQAGTRPAQATSKILP
jgi:hypothetical protein